MTIFAGEVVTAFRLNNLQPRQYFAVATSVLNLTASNQDIVGASVTFTTLTAGAFYVVNATFDMVQQATTNNDAFGRCVVDGVDQSALATFGGQVSGDRATVAGLWTGTLATAGTHTIKLAGSTSTASQFNINSGQTKILVTIYEVV